MLGQESSDKKMEFAGMEIQLYPAGTIINAKASWPLSDKGEFIGKLGYNIARRQNFGEHDKENGSGPGFTLAYKHYLKPDRYGWFAEVRMGTWFLDIDWQDNSPLRTGNSDISVFQPTAGIGYDFLLNDNKIKLGFIVAFGYEVNIVTSGEEVGQGGISLFGASLSFRL